MWWDDACKVFNTDKVPELVSTQWMIVEIVVVAVVLIVDILTYDINNKNLTIAMLLNLIKC